MGQVNYMKYYIKTFGCQMNFSDSERIAGFLGLHKFKPVKDINLANLVIFNTCGVRQTAEDRVYGQIHNIRKQEERSKNKAKRVIVLTGCLANRKDLKRRLKNKVDLFFPINDFNKFEHFIIKNCLKIKNLKLKIPARQSKCKNLSYLSIKPKYLNPKETYVPVMTGCNNFCSYCVVPYARGREISRPMEDIVKEINALNKKGCGEITLLGQNVNSYKYKNTPRLSSPRKRGSSEKIKSNDWIPVYTGMTNITFPYLLDFFAHSYPQINFKFLTSHPKDFSDELINTIAKNKNISREIHLPVQSGSDKILKAMNRPYTQKKYLALIGKIRKKIPNATFTTDAIVGFPGETEKDFQETAKIFKKIKCSEAYINKYSPRPGTTAWKLGNPISWEEKKRREKVLRALVK